MLFFILLIFTLIIDENFSYLIGNSHNLNIVGGQNATIGQFPYQISYQLKILDIYQHFCGGSIITQQWILTAGHCITTAPLENDEIVVAGILKLSDKNIGQIRNVIQKIVHPKFNGLIGPNDIALIKLETPFKLGKLIKTIELPQAEVVPGGMATISGWGSTSKSWYLIMPDILQTVQMPLLDNIDCKVAIDVIVGKSRNPFSMVSNICTGPLSGGTSACNGDSGAPLVQNNTIIGLVSWGVVPCGARGNPSVYTRVSHFIEFIKSTIT